MGSCGGRFRGDGGAGAGGDAAAGALDGDGDEVGGGEDEEVEARGDGAVGAAVVVDELAEDVVEGCAIEAGG